MKQKHARQLPKVQRVRGRSAPGRKRGWGYAGPQGDQETGVVKATMQFLRDKEAMILSLWLQRRNDGFVPAKR